MSYAGEDNVSEPVEMLKERVDCEHKSHVQSQWIILNETYN